MISAARAFTYKTRGGSTSICAMYTPMLACSAALSIALHSVALSSEAKCAVVVIPLFTHQAAVQSSVPPQRYPRGMGFSVAAGSRCRRSGLGDVDREPATDAGIPRVDDDV